MVPAKRVVFLDNDCLAVRNLDHLALQPAPAFAFHRADFGPNSGVMVLEPSEKASRSMRRITAAQPEGRVIRAPGATVAGAGDYSDQNLWGELYSEVYELPVSYNYRPRWHLSSIAARCKVVVLHASATSSFDGALKQWMRSCPFPARDHITYRAPPCSCAAVNDDSIVRRHA